MFFGFRELLSLLTVSPATENTRSDGVDVAGIFNIHLATFESCGNLFSFSFHQVRGFVFLFITFSAKYCSSSSLVVEMFLPFLDLVVCLKQ